MAVTTRSRQPGARRRDDVHALRRPRLPAVRRGGARPTPPMRLVDVRHEQTAVFAAEATAKLTRRPGLAVLTAGPGVTNGDLRGHQRTSTASPLVVLGGRAPDVPLGHGQPAGARPPAAAGAGDQARRDGPRSRRAIATGGRRRVRGSPRHRTADRCSSTSRWTCCSAAPTSSCRRATRAPRVEPDPDAIEEIARAARRGAAAGAGARLRRLGRRRGGALRCGSASDRRRAGHHQRDGPRHPARRAPPAGDHGARSAAFGQADLVVVVGTPLDFRLGYGVFGGKDGARPHVVHVADSAGQVAKHVDARRLGVR